MTDETNEKKERFLLEFKANERFRVVLECKTKEQFEEYTAKVEAEDLKWERLYNWNAQFDEADLYVDFRHPECEAQFDLEDFI